MSKSISVLIIILFLVVAGFAYLNYNRLSLVQKELSVKDQLIEDSKELISKQDFAIDQLEERIKKVIEEIITAESSLRQEKEELNQERITSLQDEINQYTVNIQEVINKINEMETRLSEEISLRKQLEQEIIKYENNIARLQEESTQEQNLEILEQKIAQLQSNKTNLQEEVQQKDLLLNIINLEQKSLREQLANYEQLLHDLQGEMMVVEKHKIEMEELQSSLIQLKEEKNKLEVVLHDREDQLLSREQQNRQTIDKLQFEVQEYEKSLKELGSEMLSIKQNISEVKDDAILESQISQLKQNIKELGDILAEKEIEWEEQNQSNKELIATLKVQLEKYKEDIQLVKFDSNLYKDDIAAEIQLQQERIASLNDKEGQIAKLVTEIEGYARKIEDYENNIAQLKEKLDFQQELSYQGQQKMLDEIISLIEERDTSQNNIDLFKKHINELQAEVAELKTRIQGMEIKEFSKYYEVKSGDNLWVIAKEKYDDGVAWTKIFSANKELIKNPDLIYPYQQLIIPE